MLCAYIEAIAGGGWEGHVFFRIINPITKKSLSTNSIKSAEIFCIQEKLYYDRTLVLEILKQLTYDPKYGWLVPKEHINQNTPISSAQKYLTDIQKELF